MATRRWLPIVPVRQDARHRQAEPGSRGGMLCSSVSRANPPIKRQIQISCLHEHLLDGEVGWKGLLAAIQVRNYSPGYMEQAPSRGHEASPQSGLGVG